MPIIKTDMQIPKKFFLLFFIFCFAITAAIVRFSGATATANADVITDGDVIRNPAAAGSAQFDVYIVKLIGAKKFKRLVLNPQVFLSYGHLKWNNVKSVSQSEIDSFKTSSLVRVEKDSKVYALTPNNDIGDKSWVNVSGPDFIAAGGDFDSVYIINAIDSGNYITKGHITDVTDFKNFLADSTSLGIDSDNDGLSDKDEAIYGTNKNNSDSDGDGYKDGEEVKNGYNPLGPGKLRATAPTPIPTFIPVPTLSPTPAPTPTPTPTPIPVSSYNIPVLDLSYIPVVNNKVDISVTGDWQNENIDALKANISALRSSLVESLVKSSKYHGYKNTTSTSSLSYQVIEDKIFYTPVPISEQFRGMDWVTPSADHIKILNNLNICNYVDNKGVKEVWVWMYHTKQVAPIESNMSGPYGNISNSFRVNDLPSCQKTYTVYDYNYGRSASMALEDHMHQVEAILRNVDANLFWNLFVGTDSGGGRCGWTHYPPNGIKDYDWNNKDSVLSDCEDWNPAGSGIKKYINCRTWAGNPAFCDMDEGLSFKIWWMQNIPGGGNNLYYNGKKLKNWWAFIGDFDKAMQDKSLTE